MVVTTRTKAGVTVKITVCRDAKTLLSKPVRRGIKLSTATTAEIIQETTKMTQVRFLVIKLVYLRGKTMDRYLSTTRAQRFAKEAFGNKICQKIAKIKFQLSNLLRKKYNGKNVKPRQKSAMASDKMKMPPAVDRRLGLLVTRRIVKPFPNTVMTERSQLRTDTNKFMFSIVNVF